MCSISYSFQSIQGMARFIQVSPRIGADLGFLARGFICINVCGVRFADFISFFLNIQ